MLFVAFALTTSAQDQSANHEYVDLGLPSGTLWATCNVGATSPEEYGDYFAWGETEPKSTYDWSTYKWCNGTLNTLTNYCVESRYGNNGFTEDKTELDLEDDAAFVNWGSGWRMPSLEQQKELLEQCTWEWTTLNGTNGYKVTGPNGNSIFLPAAGYRNGGELDCIGSDGFYWSRSLYTRYSYNAYYLAFVSDSDIWYNCSGSRCDGQSVRPVRHDGAAAKTTEFVEKSHNKVRYNFAGQRVGNDYKGLVIENGKKFMVK